MNDTTRPATQADIDAMTYEVFTRNGENKAATGRELSIGASTVSDRIKRHLARTAQDEAETQTSPYVADPANPTDEELAAAIERGLDSGQVITADEFLDRAAELEGAEDEAAAADGHEGHEHGADSHEDGAAEVTPASTGTPAATDAPATGDAKDSLVSECVKCGFHFTRPQRRQTCQSDKACQKRQDAKAAAPAGA